MATNYSLEKYLPDINNCSIAVIGLGYVGLPLSIRFNEVKNCLKTKDALNRLIIGFDINEKRVNELKKGFDRTQEVKNLDLYLSEKIIFTCDESLLNDADVYIITVPTPVDKNKSPIFEMTENACKIVANAIARRAKSNVKTVPIIIFESTFYPGATEEICIPLIEKTSSLKLNDEDPKKGFFCGYSPERINPGDNTHRLNDIIKLTSGSNNASAKWIDKLYGSIINAGTYLTKSIKIAEAAKVIENTQRDLNIALVNEFSIIFNEIGIDTLEVLNAAETKWNFIPFRPGFVGGHCIGVDPYYLTYKAEQLNLHPQLVLAGRRINDGFSKWISEILIKEISRRNLSLLEIDLLIMGFTFKKNCPDIRNTKIIDLINFLKIYKIKLTILDPIADQEEVKKTYNININRNLNSKKFDVILVAVDHDIFMEMNKEDWLNLKKENGFIFDIKGVVNKEEIDVIRI